MLRNSFFAFISLSLAIASQSFAAEKTPLEKARERQALMQTAALASQFKEIRIDVPSFLRRPMDLTKNSDFGGGMPGQDRIKEMTGEIRGISFRGMNIEESRELSICQDNEKNEYQNPVFFQDRPLPENAPQGQHFLIPSLLSFEYVTVRMHIKTKIQGVFRDIPFESDARVTIYNPTLPMDIHALMKEPLLYNSPRYRKTEVTVEHSEIDIESLPQPVVKIINRMVGDKINEAVLKAISESQFGNMMGVGGSGQPGGSPFDPGAGGFPFPFLFKF